MFSTTEGDLEKSPTFRLSLKLHAYFFLSQALFALFLPHSCFHALLCFVVAVCVFFVLFWWAFNYFFSHERISFDLKVIQYTALYIMIRSSDKVNKFWHEIILLTLAAAEIDRKRRYTAMFYARTNNLENGKTHHQID